LFVELRDLKGAGHVRIDEFGKKGRSTLGKSGRLCYMWRAQPGDERQKRRRALAMWARAGGVADFRNDPQLLLDPEHTFKTAVVTRLQRARNNRRIYLRE
jgi:hypothetical protein